MIVGFLTFWVWSEIEQGTILNWDHPEYVQIAGWCNAKELEVPTGVDVESHLLCR